MAYRAVDNHVYASVRHFLRRRHQVRTRGAGRFSVAEIFGTYGVRCLRRVHLGRLPYDALASDAMPDDMR